MLAGALLTAASLALLAVSLHTTGSNASLAPIVTLTGLASLGNGIVLPAIISAALADVAPQQAGLAVGALNTAQQFAVGVAAIGALFFTTIHGPHHAASYTTGMTWAATISIGLVLAVAALTQISARTSNTH